MAGKKPKRYALDYHGSHGEDAYIAEDDEGEYVRYEDYKALLAKSAGAKNSRQVKSYRLEMTSDPARLNWAIYITSNDLVRVENMTSSLINRKESLAKQDKTLYYYRIVEVIETVTASENVIFTTA